MTVELLPDTRARVPRGAVWTKRFGWMVPVHCGSCHRPYGMVPQKGMTFAFVLCKRCEGFGDTSQFAFAEPDEVYWARMAEEAERARQQAVAGVRETVSGQFDVAKWMAEQLRDPSSLVSKIARDWDRHLARHS